MVQKIPSYRLQPAYLMLTKKSAEVLLSGETTGNVSTSD